LKYLKLTFFAFLLLITSCSPFSKEKIVVGTTDQKGFLFTSSKDYLVVISVPLSVVSKVDKDNKVSLEKIFAIKADNYYELEKDQVDLFIEKLLENANLPYNNIRPSLAAIVSLVKQSSKPLSKSDGFFKIESLVGTSASTILKNINKESYTIRTYEMENFLPLNYQVDSLLKYTNKWYNSVIDEIKEK
jgi:hypothetical protein